MRVMHTGSRNTYKFRESSTTVPVFVINTVYSAHEFQIIEPGQVSVECAAKGNARRHSCATKSRQNSVAQLH